MKSGRRALDGSSGLILESRMVMVITRSMNPGVAVIDNDLNSQSQ